MADAVVAVRADDGLIVYSNPAWTEMFGYVTGELDGRHISVVNAPTDQAPADRAAEITDALERDGVWRGVIRNVRRDGSLLSTEAVMSRVEDPDHGVLWLAVQREITRRLAEEDAHRAAERRLRRAFEQTPAPTALVSEDLRFVDVNGAFCAMMGYGANELLGAALADITDAEDAAFDPSFFARVFASEEGPHSAERRYVTRSGESVGVDVEAAAVRGVGEEQSFAIATFSRSDPAPPSRPQGRGGRVGAR